MQNKKQIKDRKLNRLTGYNYSQDGWYFITICAQDREHFFGKIINGKMQLSEIGKITQKCWQKIPIHFPDAKLDEFIIMPNHIHGIIVIKKTTVGNKNYCSDNGNKNFSSLRLPWQTKWSRSLSSIVRGFKIGVTKWCRENKIVLNENYCSTQFSWQKSFYDHIIRDEKSLNKIREYIADNPSKWERDRNNQKNFRL